MRAVAWSFFVAGCAASLPRVPPDSIARAETMPVGYEAVTVVMASCRGFDRVETMDGERLDSFDCNRARLEHVLAERASEASAEMLVGTSCGEDGGGLRCSATAVRAESGTLRARAVPDPDPGPVPGAVAVERWDEPRASVAEDIEIDFELARAVEPRRARRATDVGETGALPVSHVDLGVLTARCEADECSPRELRQALRIAAGALGASDLVGVRCFERQGVRECVADAAMPQIDE